MQCLLHHRYTTSPMQADLTSQQIIKPADIGNSWEALIWCNATQNFCCARAAKDQNDTDCCHHQDYLFSLPNLPLWVAQDLINETNNRPTNAPSPGLSSVSILPTAAYPTGLSTSSSGSTTASSPPSTSDTKLLVIGLAVGGVLIILGCFSICVCFWWFCFRKNTLRRSTEAEDSHGQPVNSGAVLSPTLDMSSPDMLHIRQNDGFARHMSIPAIAPETTVFSSVGPPFQLSAENERMLDHPPYRLPSGTVCGPNEESSVDAARIDSLASAVGSNAGSATQGIERFASDTSGILPHQTWLRPC